MYIIPCEFVCLGSNGNRDEVTLVGESTYDYPKIIIALANWDWANKVHSYRLPRMAWDWQAMEQARFQLVARLAHLASLATQTKLLDVTPHPGPPEPSVSILRCLLRS